MSETILTRCNNCFVLVEHTYRIDFGSYCLACAKEKGYNGGFSLWNTFTCSTNFNSFRIHRDENIPDYPSIIWEY